MDFEIIFLGTGTSAGVPMIGCNCLVCTSDDSRDKRTRPSVLVRYKANVSTKNMGATQESQKPKSIEPISQDNNDNILSNQWHNFLIDTAPELRQQAIKRNINHIDGVLYTHSHADHILGIDDLRRFNAVMKAPLNIYGEQKVLEQLQDMFSYIFKPHKNINKSFVANLIPCPIESEHKFDLFAATWTPIRLMHGRLPIVGYRIDLAGQSLAYCTDVSKIPPQSYKLLQDLDVLVIDALRYRHHPTHMNVDQSLEAIDNINPKRAFLTHIAHDISHAKLSDELPENTEIAYDGLVVDLSD